MTPKIVDFLFIYEVRNRELDSVCLLGAYLELKGYTVAYLNTWDCLYRSSIRYSAKVLVISACYDDDTYQYFTNHAYYFEKVVNLQWEQVLGNQVVCSLKKTSWSFSGIALKTYHICWGENSRFYLNRRYNIENILLPICGYLPLDFYRPEFKSLIKERTDLFNKYCLNPNKKTILFVSSFSGIGLPKSEEAILGDGDNNGTNDIQVESQRIIVNWFIKLLEKNDNIQIIYRPHPSEAKSKILLSYADKIPSFFVISEESIKHWIINSDIVCNWQSTSMIEMYMSSKKTLILRPIAIPFMDDMPIFEEGHFKAIDNYDEFEYQVINDACDDFPVDKDCLLYFYDIQDIPTFQRIGNFLIDVLLADEYHSEPLKSEDSSLKKALVRTRTNVFSTIARVVDEMLEKSDLVNSDSAVLEWVEQYNYFYSRREQNKSSEKERRYLIDTFKRIIKSSNQ